MPIRASLVLAVLSVLTTSASAATLCTVLQNAQTRATLLQEGTCDQSVTPASTFKIAISLMGYDSGFLKDEHTPALPFRPGYPDWLPEWRTTTDPTNWIKYSVVWYSQQVTQALGFERFQAYATRLGYGNHDVSGDPGKNNGLTRAWLSSSLQISPLQQIEFLDRLVTRQLPVSAHAFDMTQRITAVTTLPDGWDVHGKTGMGFPKRPDGTADEDHAYGWFVGWADRGTDTIVFARLIQEDKREPVTAGVRAKTGLLEELPALLAKR